MIIDTHAHLADAEFDNDLPEVLERARKVGVRAVVTVCEVFEDAHKILQLAELHPEIKPAAGLYPTILNIEKCEKIENFIRNNYRRLFAVGEVGLDYWKVKDEDERALQREIFARMIALSLETSLPLNVHSRSAGRYAISLLLEKGAEKVQLHAFDGKASSAMPAVEAGYFFSIPPSIIRSIQKQKLVRQLPLEHLLVETDSPVLGPEKSERNEPANALISLKAVADLKGISVDDMKDVVFENTIRLYGDLCNTLVL